MNVPRLEDMHFQTKRKKRHGRATLLCLYVSTPLSVQRILTYPRYITEHQLCIIFCIR